MACLCHEVHNLRGFINRAALVCHIFQQGILLVSLLFQKDQVPHFCESASEGMVYTLLHATMFFGFQKSRKCVYPAKDCLDHFILLPQLPTMSLLFVTLILAFGKVSKRTFITEILKDHQRPYLEVTNAHGDPAIGAPMSLLPTNATR